MEKRLCEVFRCNRQGNRNRDHEDRLVSRVRSTCVDRAYAISFCQKKIRYWNDTDSLGQQVELAQSSLETEGILFSKQNVINRIRIFIIVQWCFIESGEHPCE